MIVKLYKIKKSLYKKGDAMKLEKNGIAGTLESGDIMVEIRPSEENGIKVELVSTVASLFGKKIEQVIRETAQELGVENAEIIANDKGSLDCTIKARVTTAVLRASGEKFKW